MSFERPWWLFGLLLAGVLGWWLRRRVPVALPLPEADRWSNRRSFRTVTASVGPWLVRSLVLVLLVLAVANPRWPDQSTRVPVDGISIQFVLDVSGSMNSPDFAPNAVPPMNRLDAAKRAFELLTNGGEWDGITFKGRANDQLGLVAFAAVPEVVCPLTLNHAAFGSTLSTLQPKGGIDAGTNIGDALGVALAKFQDMTVSGDKRRKVIVLLSDGEHNKEGDEVLKPSQAMQLAKRMNVPIYTIDCGGEGTNESEAALRQEGRAALARLAEETTGTSFIANSPAELVKALEQLDQLERRSTDSLLFRRYHDTHLWLATTAFVLYLLLHLLEASYWRKQPS
jgi:Ca-activated chloride channel homolog